MADTLYIMPLSMPRLSLCVAPDRAIIMRQPCRKSPNLVQSVDTPLLAEKHYLCAKQQASYVRSNSRRHRRITI